MIPSTISEFVWRRPALAGCIGGIVIRDTRGCALDDTERLNFFCALPMPIIGCRFVGDAHLIDRPGQIERPWTGALQADFYFAGARLKPRITWNPGAVYFMHIAFFPDALAAMTGLDLSVFTGRVVPAGEALPQPLLGICRNFFDTVPCRGVEASFAALQDEIEILWAGRRPAGTGAERWTDWSRSLMARAAATGAGRSTRQIARRVKSWTGVGQRDLQRFAHIEEFYFNALEAPRTGDIDWAALAVASGFTDQAHMIRRFKQLTGFTPEQWRESRDQEPFWQYRLFERIADDFLHGPTRCSAAGADQRPQPPLLESGAPD